MARKELDLAVGHGIDRDLQQRLSAVLSRRALLSGTAAVGAALVAACENSSPSGTSPGTSTTPSGSQLRGSPRVTAIAQVFGDGAKLTAVALEYQRPIDNGSLTRSTYAVDGRTVTKTYANTAPELTDEPADGTHVIIELALTDSAAALWVGPGGGPAPESGGGPGMPTVGQSGTPGTIEPAQLTVTQKGSISTVDGEQYAASPTALQSSETVDLVADDFRQFVYADPDTSESLAYNLFIPRGYDDAKQYPLVLFMHDASVVGAPVRGPLVQGLGAVSWAQDQAGGECFVLAPQYPTVVVDDAYQPSPLFDTTVNLVNALTQQYSIDPRRLYATGQSMGAMMTLGMNIRHPDLFAASLVVAGQWPVEQATPLVNKKLWIVVSQGDDKAFPGENAITGLAEQHGTTVAKATWSGTSTPDELDEQAKAMQGKGATINYTAFDRGSLLAPGATGSEHNATWRLAYSIPSIRHWILAQRL